jgi:hypothetical protein
MPEISKIAFSIGGKLKLGSVDKRTFQRNKVRFILVPAD